MDGSAAAEIRGSAACQRQRIVVGLGLLFILSALALAWIDKMSQSTAKAAHAAAQTAPQNAAH